MNEKKNSKLIGIIIGSIACVAIIAVSAFAISKLDTPIAIVKGSADKAENLLAEENDETLAGNANAEESINWDELEIIEEEDPFAEEEIVVEEFDETTTGYQNKNINYPANTIRPATTKSTTTKPATTTTTTKVPSNKETTTKKEVGMFGYELDQLDPNTSHFFTSKDAWQRNFGFCKMYDDAAPLIAFYYDTERVFFTYGEYDWMVQFWKGQYGFIFIGSEIGVYHKEKGNEVEFYDCAEDENCLKMKMTLYRDGDTLLFDRPEGYYWWITGFVPGKLDKFADRSELKVVAKITLFDTEMRDAFLAAFEEAGFVEESKWVEPEIEPNKAYTRKKFYTVSGNTVSVTWQ